jgi:hypothetical protein
MQSTIVISNGTGAAVRAAINNALQSIVTMNSGNAAPNPTYPFMIWADTTGGPNNTILRIRNSQNTGWIVFAVMNDAAQTLVFTRADHANQATSIG